MSFADSYLSKHLFWNESIIDEPNQNLKYCVVIPVFNEDRFLFTLNSLWGSFRPRESVEIIIVINSSEIASQNILDQNKRTLKEVNEWLITHQEESFKCHVITAENLPKKHAGAGLARKIGMDEAICRFNKIGRMDGVIISLDADSIVTPNYFLEIEKVFSGEKINTAILQFRHQCEDQESEAVQKAIIVYELYLRYYINALKLTGFPYAFYTIGSCFCVRASAYIKQGGMNRKQAGEDFYFLQKVFALGEIKEIKQATVFPSGRISDRVPFGTGPMVKEIIENNFDFQTYDIKAFLALKVFFQKIPFWKTKSIDYIRTEVSQLDKPLVDFLKTISWEKRVFEIQSNSATQSAFVKRFFRWFDAFQVIKYLNFSHENYFVQKPLIQVTQELIKILSDSETKLSTYEGLLDWYIKYDLESR